MHRSIRRLIFAVFVIIFLVSAPLVVLYTAGFRLNISNRSLLQTGVLAVSTSPRGSSIILNGLELAQKSPTVLQRLIPKEHEVILRKRGYHDWTQKVRIEEGKTTYATARLFAASSAQVLDDSEAALALRLQPIVPSIDQDEASVVLLDNGTNTEVRLGTGDGQLVGLLPRAEYELLEDDSDYILLVNERGAAFVVARQGGDVVELPVTLQAYDWLDSDHLLLWSDGTEVNIYAAETKTRTFITRDGQPVVDVAWHPEADSFFVATSEVLSAYDVLVYATRQVTPLLYRSAINDIWLDASGRNLYFTTETEATSVFKLPLNL